MSLFSNDCIPIRQMTHALHHRGRCIWTSEKKCCFMPSKATTFASLHMDKLELENPTQWWANRSLSSRASSHRWERWSCETSAFRTRLKLHAQVYLCIYLLTCILTYTYIHPCSFAYLLIYLSSYLLACLLVSYLKTYTYSHSLTCMFACFFPLDVFAYLFMYLPAHVHAGLFPLLFTCTLAWFCSHLLTFFRIFFL